MPRHEYYGWRDEDAWYALRAVHVPTEGEDLMDGWVALSRDAALMVGRNEPVWDVVACDCGQDALSVYAREHPGSGLAVRLELVGAMADGE